MKDSVSVIIPAFNEEIDIAEAVSTVLKLTSSCIKDYEIIVINDGSIDHTGEIVAKLAQQNKRIRVVTHKKNLGIGEVYRSGITYATKKYLTGFPADLDMTANTLQDLIMRRQKADMVSSYMTNMSSRKFARKILSVFYIKFMNLIFGLDLNYYNGYFICSLELLRSLKLKSKGFTIYAEIKVKLIKKGVSLREIPFETKPRLHGISKATSLKSIWQTIYGVLSLVRDIYF